MESEELHVPTSKTKQGTEAQFTDDTRQGEEAPAWDEVEAGRYMPRRIKGSCKGRALG